MYLFISVINHSVRRLRQTFNPNSLIICVPRKGAMLPICILLHVDTMPSPWSSEIEAVAVSKYGFFIFSDLPISLQRSEERNLLSWIIWWWCPMILIFLAQIQCDLCYAIDQIKLQNLSSNDIFVRWNS